MKNFKCITIALLVTIFAISICGCQTKEEKAAKEAERAAENANRRYAEAVENYNDVLDNYNKYKYYQERLGN